MSDVSLLESRISSTDPCRDVGSPDFTASKLSVAPPPSPRLPQLPITHCTIIVGRDHGNRFHAKAASCCTNFEQTSVALSRPPTGQTCNVRSCGSPATVTCRRLWLRVRTNVGILYSMLESQTSDAKVTLMKQQLLLYGTRSALSLMRPNSVNFGPSIFADDIEQH